MGSHGIEFLPIPTTDFNCLTAPVETLAYIK